MREIRVKIKLWNILDEEKIRTGRLKPKEYECVVDTGSLRMSIPEYVFRELNLMKSTKKVPVEYADGRRKRREIALGIRLEIMNRDCETLAIIEPNSKEILLGMLELEGLDLYIDTKNGKLFPNPESPNEPLYKQR